MGVTRTLTKAALLLAAASTTSGKLHTTRGEHDSHIRVARQAASTTSTSSSSGAILNVSAYMATGVANGTAAPGAQPGDASGQYVIVSNQLGADDASQVPHCPTVFIGSADVDGSLDQGWKALPQVLGFDLKRDLTVSGNAVLPYYVERGKDASKIKRVVLVQPGKPRDSWKYINLVRNSLICASATMGADLGSVLVGGPAWLDANDHAAGATEANDLYWPASNAWAEAAQSAGPGDASVSTFRAFDQLISQFFDKSKYPNVNNVYVAGHSAGGMFTQRYAVLRTPSAEDANLNFWVGNAGSYVWPSDQLPFKNGTCKKEESVKQWPFSLSDTSSIPPYGKKGFDKAATLQTYFGRNVHYNLGMLDYGAGDTHCQASYEGWCHLSRGSNLQTTLKAIPAASNHTFDFVADTSHQDYKMFSAASSQKRLFVDGINDHVAVATGSGSSAAGGGSNASAAGGSSKSAAGSNWRAITTTATAVVAASVVSVLLV